jgi:tetratricopeptide (TPR) repeat protein
MGLLCLHAKQFDQAVEWIAQAIRQDSKSVYLWSLGTALRNSGRNEEALKAFDKSVQIEPANAQLWTNLGHVLIELERPADALLSFRHAANLDPKHWDAVNGCGTALLKVDRFEEALESFERALRLRPDFLPSLKTKAWLLAYLHRFEEVIAVRASFWSFTSPFFRCFPEFPESLRAFRHRWVRCPRSTCIVQSPACRWLSARASACRRTRGPTTRQYSSSGPALLTSPCISPISVKPQP